MKTRKAPGHSNISMEFIAASGEVWFHVVVELSQNVLGWECELNRS